MITLCLANFESISEGKLWENGAPWQIIFKSLLIILVFKSFKSDQDFGISSTRTTIYLQSKLSAVSGSSSWNAKIDSLDGIVMCKLQSGEVQRIENHVWTHQMHYTCVTYSVSATFSCFRSIFTTYSNIPVRRWASKQEITVVCNLHEKWIFKR